MEFRVSDLEVEAGVERPAEKQGEASGEASRREKESGSRRVMLTQLEWDSVWRK
jgi:hypothetical protein